MAIDADPVNLRESTDPATQVRKTARLHEFCRAEKHLAVRAEPELVEQTTPLEAMPIG